VTTHSFLSDEWFAAAQRLLEEHGIETPVHADLVINVLVTDTPFGGDRTLHLGARNGQGSFGHGHVDDADLTLTTDYDTAKEIFVAGDPGAGMQAFLVGKVKIQGDFAKVMAAGTAGPIGNPELAEALQAITS